MKRIYLAILIMAIAQSTFAQESQNDKDWFASVGINAINSQGTQSPFGDIGDWATGLPISFAVELKWDTGLAIEQALTLNSFSEGGVVDGVTLEEDLTYFALDTHAKYYFGQKIFPEVKWLDLYGNAGFGLFSLDTTNVTFNLGGGILFWLNTRQTTGIRLQSIAKFALDSKDSGIDSNHFQTHLQVFFLL
ncbi:hypothetical protein [Winogradskyella alexanderae]|uniref:Outer membrane protein beta-barrel domain-containing protein n=1 Tax=Winogradskyella alexanderae TaxID=2877123 RepID=A0ABS7XR13_9FLAO|nr:hypothetical protein [Winogradskyella alexanderae]MCA0132455.1 hypothetical protein [Winogradskyella alexanderae]